MRIELAFPSKYLREADLQGREAAVVIAGVRMEDLQVKGTGKSERKPVVYFKGKDKGLVLNKTNAKSIADKLGSETDEWQGKRVVLYPTTTRFGSETVPCIRIKVPPQRGPQRRNQNRSRTTSACPRSDHGD